MHLHEMITDLCSLPAPSGFEGHAYKRISELLEGLVDSITTDPMGNLIAVKKCGKRGAKKLMLNAHMDEIGLIVTGYEGGFLRFSRIGGVDPRMLPARELQILTDPPLYGVIGTMPPHTLPAEEREKALEADKLFIDAGLTEDEAKRLIPLGTPIVFGDGCTLLNDNNVCGKSLDDRACVAMLIKVMENIKNEALNLDVYLLISTQEEVGLRGATTGTYAINPDYAIVMDVTHAATPDSKKGTTMDAGKGAAIGIGPNMTRTISDKLLSLAAEKQIPYQSEVLSGRSGTDAWAVQVTRCGVATGLVSVPVKYMHTPVELMNLTDAQAAVDLITAFTTTLGKEEYTENA